MTRKYILTGGPGSGKSSILLELASRGQTIIREAAEDVIRLEQARGNPKPWELPDFQRKILDLQKLNEVWADYGTLPSSEVYIDRGVHDGLAYTSEGTDIYNLIQRETQRKYAGVFLIENLGSIQTNDIRREDQAGALELERKLDFIYQSCGYLVQRIASAPVKERADMILEIVHRGPWLRSSEEKYFWNYSYRKGSHL